MLCTRREINVDGNFRDMLLVKQLVYFSLINFLRSFGGENEKLMKTFFANLQVEVKRFPAFLV